MSRNVKKVTKKKVKKTSTRRKKNGAEVHASDKVRKLTELESLRFGKLDAEVRNNLQGIKICDYKLVELKRQYQEQVAGLANLKSRHEMELKRINPEYQGFLQSISKKYGIPDTKRLVIDPDSGTVRDAATDV